MKIRATIITLLVALVLLAGSATTPLQANASESRPSICGKWQEYWGIPGKTDVAYHDQYGVTRTADCKVKISTLNKKQVIEDEQLDQDLLTFSQHTDVYIVKYSLRVQSNGQLMVGTATTPRGIYPIIWERTADGSDACQGDAKRPAKDITANTIHVDIAGIWKVVGSTAEFAISFADGAIHIDGWDGADGEKFAISKVTWDGKRLKGTFTMPSTNHTTYSDLLLIDENTLKGAYRGAASGEEIWKRVIRQ